MKILACYSVWNDDERIGVSMRSVLPFVTDFIIVDGRYEGFFEGKPVNSTDFTLDIVKRFPNVKVVSCEKALRPVEKRNIYLKEPSDWYLLMDADEILFGDLKRLRAEIASRTDILSYNIGIYTWLRELAERHLEYRCHLFHRDVGFHYDGYHWVCKNKQGNIIESYSRTIDYVWKIQLNELLPIERYREKDRWRTWRTGKGSGW